MDIIRISEEPDHIHVELVAASEMSFDLTDSSDAAIADVCMIAPVLLRMDGDLAEMYDDAGRTQPKAGDMAAVRAFLLRWRSKLKNCELAIPGFPERS